MSRVQFMVWALAGCVALAGCQGSDGPPRSITSGSVAFDGEPVLKGMIRFIPEKGPPVQAEVIDGKYLADYKGGVPVGKSRVEIDGYKETGKTVQISPDRSEPEMKQVIPDKFNEKSTLSVEISTAKTNTHDFDLKP